MDGSSERVVPIFKTGTATKIGDSVLAIGPAAMLLIGVPLFALAAGCGMYMLTGQIWLGILVGMLFLSIFGVGRQRAVAIPGRSES